MEPLRLLAVMLSWILSGTWFCEGSVVLTQTHPAAPYVCRTGNITLRCQYGGVENVLAVVWLIGGHPTTNPSTIPGHTALPRTTTYQEVVVDSYTNVAGRYRCSPVLTNGSTLDSNVHESQIEAAEVTLSSLTLASRTATTLSVTWLAGYPKCYSFTVSHSTQDGSLTVTQPADSDTSHTLTSLQPGTTYRIEVEAVRKGDGADGQRAKAIGNFTTEEVAYTSDVMPSGTTPATTSTSALSPTPTAPSDTAGSVVLTQTHPAAPYVCRTGNITLRCQYESVENVLVVLWIIGFQITSNPSTIPGHTALPRTTTYQEVVVDSYANLAAEYRCTPTLSNGSQLLSNQYNPQYESAEVTLSSLTLASRTTTTLGVTWSAGYPKCYSFTVSHSTQDGYINVTQPANSDTSHTLTSLQPGTTYKFEVEAVRKGDGADGQRAKLLVIYTTDGPDYTECTFRFCKRRRNALCTIPDAAGDCTNKVTSCKAAYYSVNERPPPPKCSRKNRCAGLIGERFEGCLIKWANCVKKAFRSQHGRTPSNLRKKVFFKTLEYPCSG